MNTIRLFFCLLLLGNHWVAAHGTIEEVSIILMEGILDYRKSSTGSIVFEQINESILSEQTQPLIESNKVSLKASDKSSYAGLSTDVSFAFLDSNHLVIGASLQYTSRMSNANRSHTQYLSKASGDHFRILSYLCTNGTDQVTQTGSMRRPYTCAVIQSRKAHGYFKDSSKLESYLNALKIKSIAPDLFTKP